MGGNSEASVANGVASDGGPPGTDETNHAGAPESDARKRGKPAARRGSWVAISITLMIVGFLVVVTMRDRIRAHWWAYRLSHTTSIPERTYYLSLIAGLGDRGIGAINSLIRDPDPDVRCLVVVALQSCSDDPSSLPFAQLLLDESPQVRNTAATALAFMSSPERTRPFQILDSAAMMRHAGAGDAAASAVGGMARAPACMACGKLVRELMHSPFPRVRAQAAESLGVLTENHAGTLKELIGPFNDERGQCLGTYPFQENECELFEALVKALDDDTEFSGRLCLEQEIQSATAFAAMSGQSVAGLADAEHRNTTRKVADIAAAVLSRMTGHEIRPRDPMNDAETKSLTARCRGWYEERLAARIATTEPTSLPAAIEKAMDRARKPNG